MYRPRQLLSSALVLLATAYWLVLLLPAAILVCVLDATLERACDVAPAATA